MRNINFILQAIKDYKGIRTNAALAEFWCVKVCNLPIGSQEEHWTRN